MEKIYSEHPKEFSLVESSVETIRSIMNFSKSLYVTDYKNLKFESILN